MVLGAMFGMAVADECLDYNPFHDVKIPKVPGRRVIKVATPEQFLKVRACIPTKPAQVFSTLPVSSGLQFCEAIRLQPDDFDFEAGILRRASVSGRVASASSAGQDVPGARLYEERQTQAQARPGRVELCADMWQSMTSARWT